MMILYVDPGESDCESDEIYVDLGESGAKSDDIVCSWKVVVRMMRLCFDPGDGESDVIVC